MAISFPNVSLPLAPSLHSGHTTSLVFLLLGLGRGDKSSLALCPVLARGVEWWGPFLGAFPALEDPAPAEAAGLPPVNFIITSSQIHNIHTLQPTTHDHPTHTHNLTDTPVHNQYTHAPRQLHIPVLATCSAWSFKWCTILIPLVANSAQLCFCEQERWKEK